MNYNYFNTSSNHSMNLYNALKYCKENNERSLIFDTDTYEFYDDMAFEEVMYVSNHDIYEIKRIPFLIKEMTDFIIDGNGSKFIFHDSVIPFVLQNSENITLKNFSVDYDETMMLDAHVYNLQDNYIDVEIKNNDSYCVSDSKLYCYDAFGHRDIVDFACIMSIGDNKNFTKNSCDWFEIADSTFTDLGDKRIRINGIISGIEEGTHIVLKSFIRHSCAVVLKECKNIKIENVSIFRSYGMGILAQKTENVSIDKLNVVAKENNLFSLSADATHFVNCKGVIEVRNSSFSEQMDDALNIHGIFTKIVDKTDDYIMVKYMHQSAKGINIYDDESEIAVLNPKTLIPDEVYKISKVEVINMEYTRIYIKGGTQNIKVGNVVEDLTWKSDLIFENNKVFNNRARGLLIAAKGNVLIKNNYFNTPGVSILFESDGEFWFESGGTTNVIIKQNEFNNCKYSNAWGENVIEVVPRKEFNDGKYYHKNIEIIGNRFIDCDTSLISLDNFEKVLVQNNVIENCKSDKYLKVANCKLVESDI